MQWDFCVITFYGFAWHIHVYGIAEGICEAIKLSIVSGCST